ncbi:MAG: WD40 repeat domain-containing protein [Bryobacterales bacterium]|nr:WD40 repeat domain-containing protein [Bryobacterales bacterium]
MRALCLFLAALPLAAQADRTITLEAVPGSVQFSSDGKSLITACRDNQIRVIDVNTGKQLRAKKHEGGSLMSGGRLVDRDANKNIRVWDLTADRYQQIMDASAGRGRTALSSDGKHLAIADTNARQVLLYEVGSAKRRHSLPDGLGGAAELLFSPDGSSVVSANYDNDVRVWNTRSGELLRKMEDMTGAMFAGQFTPDGKQLLLAGLDETIYVFDAKTFQRQRTIKGHDETISALAVSPDGKMIVTGGFDVRTTQNPVKVVLWDAASGKAVKTLRSPHRVVSLAFSPDSKMLAMTSGDKEITLWKLSN